MVEKTFSGLAMQTKICGPLSCLITLHSWSLCVRCFSSDPFLRQAPWLALFNNRQLYFVHSSVCSSCYCLRSVVSSAFRIFSQIRSCMSLHSEKCPWLEVPFFPPISRIFFFLSKFWSYFTSHLTFPPYTKGLNKGEMIVEFPRLPKSRDFNVVFDCYAIIHLQLKIIMN